MDSTTFFFGTEKDLENAVALTRGDGLETGTLTPSPAEPSIRVWAATLSRPESARAKELFISANLPPIGYYDLPEPERPLPTDPPVEAPNDSEPTPIGRIWPAFIAQCFADTRKIRIITHHDKDLTALMPYLNSVMKTAQYNPGAPTLSLKKDVRAITLYPHKIAIAKADDMLDAWLIIRGLKDLIVDVSSRMDEITPDHKKSKPPTPLDIYKLLPRSNCGKCGCPTCLAFAALLAAAEADADDCPSLKETRHAEARFRLLAMLGATP